MESFQLIQYLINLMIERSPNSQQKVFVSHQTNMNLFKLQKKILIHLRQMKLKNSKQLHRNYNFVVHGKKILFCNKSYFLFTPQNSFRKLLVWIIEWKWFDYAVTFIIFLNTVTLTLQDYSFRQTGTDPNPQKTEVLDLLEYIFVSVFFLEFLLKSLAMGLLFEQNTYLRDGWNLIDFLVVISSVMSFFPNSIKLSALRTIRILRPLRSINAVKGMRLLVSSLLKSLPDLANVVVFLLFIIILFAILGMQLFGGVFENRCRLTPHPIDGVWLVAENITRLCGQYQCPPKLYCGNPQQLNLPLNHTEMMVDYLNFGYTRFDNIFLSLFTIFQALTMEGWSNQVYVVTLDTVISPLVYFYFVMLVLFGGIFIVNLILAVINESFLNENEKPSKKLNEELGSLPSESGAQSPKWIPIQTMLSGKPIENHLSYNLTPNQNNLQLLSYRMPKEIKRIFVEMEFYDKPCLSRVQDFLTKKVIDTTAFTVLSTLFILANTVTLSMDRYPMPESEIAALELANLVFTIAFAIEMFLKLIGYGVYKYCSDGLNIFDAAIVIVSLTESILDSADITLSSGGFAAITAFRTLRLFRIFKLARSWTTFRNLLIAIGSTMVQISYFSILLMLFMLISSLLGMELFAYRIYDDDGVSPRLNFDTLYNALITIFVLLTNEGWPQIVYVYLNAVQSMWPLAFFVTVIVIGNFILLKLFIAILIYNFSKSNEVTAEKAKEDQQKKGTKFQIVDKLIKSVKTFDFKRKIKRQRSVKRAKSYFQENPDLQVNLSSSRARGTRILDAIQTQRKKVRPRSLKIDQAIQFNRQEQQDQIPRERKSTKKCFTQLLKQPDQDDDRGNGQNQELNEPSFQSFKVSNQPMNFSPNRRKGRVGTQLFKSAQQMKQMEVIEENEDCVSEDDDTTIDEDEMVWVLQLKTKLVDIFEKLVQESINMEESEKKMVKQLEQEYPNDIDYLIDQLQLHKQLFRTYASEKKVDTELFRQILSTREEFNYRSIEGKSLFLFDKESRFRRAIFALINHRLFDFSIVFFILFSSIVLALDDPLLDPRSLYKSILYLIDVVTTSIFLIEVVLKTISFGFVINGTNSYLRQFDNAFDFIVVAFSMAGIFSNEESQNFNKLKVLRILRVLRPLRLIARNDGLKLVINCLIHSIPNVLNLLVVCFVFFLLFSIFGINYFKGTFYFCDQYDGAINKSDCMDHGGNWINNDYNFDNIFNAFVTLYVLASTEGWIDMMWNGVDSVGIGKAPVENYRLPWAVFYIFFIIIGSFFVMNLFAGVVVDSFNQEKDKQKGFYYLNEEQQDWMEVQKKILESKPQISVPVPRGWLRRQVYLVVQSKYFDVFIFCIIGLNTLVFLVQWQRQPAIMGDISMLLNFVFLGVFLLECLLKITALQMHYFKQSWNLFDFSVAILTVVGILLEQVHCSLFIIHYSLFQTSIVPNVGTATSVLRSFKIIRVLRLIKTAKSLRIIFQTFIITLPSLVHVGGILIITLFMFSVLGMNLYAFNKHGVGVNDKANFQTFLNSFFTLFKCSNGEDWNFVLADTMRSIQPNSVCYDVSSYYEYKQYGFNGCGNSLSFLFFLSFQLLVGMVMLSLFVAVILEGFTKSSKDENSVVKPVDIENFIEQWSKHDHKAQGFILVRNFYRFMNHLPEPLGWEGFNFSLQIQRKILSSYQLPVYRLKNLNEPLYNYWDVLKTVSYQLVQEKYMIGEFDENCKMQQRLNKQFKNKNKHSKYVIQTHLTSTQIVAGSLIRMKLKDQQKNLEVRRREGKELPNELPRPFVKQRRLLLSF